MKKYLLALAALALLFVGSCKKDKKPGDEDVVVPATGITLNKHNIELPIGDSETLVASVKPSNSTDKVTWESTDEAVATVTDGVVTAIKDGDATIIAKAGKFSAECTLTVLDYPKGAVDLGLVMKRTDGSTYILYWAESNLCESGLCANPEDYGDYYAWGETEPYYSSLDPLTWKDGKTSYFWGSYKWCNGSASSLTKYNTEDGITVLQRGEKSGETMDDVARAKLGGKWRMPTDEEWTALREKCTWTWTTQNGVSGRLVTADNGNSIFLPAGGGWYAANLNDLGGYGYYWSSSLDYDSPTNAWEISFSYHLTSKEHNIRCFGRSIRPVTE